MVSRCRSTGLPVYKTKTAAQRAEQKSRHLRGGTVYQCGNGTHWHVTAMIGEDRDTARRPARWDRSEWDAATLVLWARCRDACEWCGLGLAGQLERHHRQRRAVGGDHLGNLVALHPPCHAWVHAHPEDARERGFIVSSYARHPDLVPLTLADGRVVTLQNDGGLVTTVAP